MPFSATVSILPFTKKLTLAPANPLKLNLPFLISYFIARGILMYCKICEEVNTDKLSPTEGLLLKDGKINPYPEEVFRRYFTSPLLSSSAKDLYYLLNRTPVTPIIHHDNIYLRVDATYFKNFCVVCYQDDTISYTQLFRFSDAERYEEIKEDLHNLLHLGLQIASITCDGHKATLKAIKK